MDQSLWVKALHAHGPSMLNVGVGNVSQENPDDDTEDQCMWELIQKKSQILFQKRVPNPAEGKKLRNDIGLQPVPLEIYRKNLSVTQRRNLFYKTLCRKDILYLRVINIRNPYDYKLQLVAKHGNCMRIEDLQIVMYLPKIPEETKFFKGGLWEFEYIRGALCSCSVDERKLFVTLDPRIFEGVPAPKLGKVGVNDLPSSLWAPEIGKSIYDYLIKSKVFYRTHVETVLQNVLGVERNQLFSLFQEWHGKEYPFEETGANFPKMFTGAKCWELLRKSFRLYTAGNIPKAFKYANKALSLDPDAVYTRICRGVLNVQKGNLCAAFEDAKDALTLDPESELARKQMSALLIVAAQKYFKRRDFTNMCITLLVAIGLNPNHFKTPAGMEAFKVVRYIYRMTRDPQLSFPFAPTHQKILSDFFKQEGSARRKFVLPPNYEDDQASVAARISRARQMIQNQRNVEQNQRHHRRRSKSGGRRRSSRSCSIDKRSRSKSRTSELNLQQESRNRTDNVNPEDISGDPTPNQLRCDGHVFEHVNLGLNQQGCTSNQLCGSDARMNSFEKGQFQKHTRNTNPVVCVDSTSALEKDSRMQISFENQVVTSEGNVNQESTLGRQINNVTTIAPFHSTRNKHSGSGMQRNNLSQGADSTPNQQSESGLLRTNPGQNVSIDSVSTQQQGTNISNSNQEVTVHNGSNMPCKDPQNNRNQCADAILNQSLPSSRDIHVQKSGSLINISNQCVSNDSMSNKIGRSQTHDSNGNIGISVDSISSQLPIPNIWENILNQGVSVNTMPNQKSTFQIPGISANPDGVAHSVRTRIPFINDDDRIVPANCMFNSPIKGDGVAHSRRTMIPFINDDDRIVPANRITRSLNESPAFGSASSDSNTLRSSEKQSISIDCVPNQQYVCETPKNKENPFPQNSNMKEMGRYFNQSDSFDTLNQQQRSGMLKISPNPDVSVDFTNGSGLHQSHTDQRVIDLDAIRGHGKLKTSRRNFVKSTKKLNQFSSAYSFSNQPHGSGMVSDKTNQVTSIYSTPGQQSGSETWMSNLNWGTTVDPKPWQQGGRVIPSHPVPVFCTDRTKQIHELIKTEAMINASNKSPTDASSKELRGVGTSETNKKRDSTLNQRHVSKSRSSFHWEDSVNSRSNLHLKSRKLNSSRNRVISISKPNEIRNSTKRASAADESSRPGSWMSNWPCQLSINSTPYQERDCKNLASSSDLEVISVNCVRNEHSGPRMGNSDENEPYMSHSRRVIKGEDGTWVPVPYMSHSRRVIKGEDGTGVPVPYMSHSRRELEDVICLDQYPGQKSFSESRSYRSDDRYGSVCCTCGQSKHSGSKCRRCDVDNRHRWRYPSYQNHWRRSRSPYHEKRRRSRPSSYDYRRTQPESRYNFSCRDRRRNSRSRSPDDLYGRRMSSSQFF